MGSGWSNTIPFPFIVVNPATGSPIFVIDETGAHVVSDDIGIDLIQGTGGPPPAVIQFSDLSGSGADAGIISSQNIAGGMAISLASGEGSVGTGAGGSGHLQLDPHHSTLDFQDVSGAGSGFSRLDLQAGVIDVTGTLEVAGEVWHDVVLQNGWANRAGWNNLGYLIDPTGRVFLRGSIAGGVFASGTRIGSIPAGWRPATHDAVNGIVSDNLPAAYAAANGSCRLQVQLGGDMYIYGTGAGPLYFDGFNYSTVA